MEILVYGVNGLCCCAIAAEDVSRLRIVNGDLSKLPTALDFRLCRDMLLLLCGSFESSCKVDYDDDTPPVVAEDYCETCIRRRECDC